MRFRPVTLACVLVLLICAGISPVLSQDATGISGLQIVLSVAAKPADIQTDAVRITAEVVAGRLEALDIHPYVVQVLSGKAIQVQMPGLEDQQFVLDTLTQTALLELVDFSGLNDKIVDFTGSTILTSAWESDPNLPPRDAALSNPLTDKPFETVLTGADFVTASTDFDTYGQWTIAFELTDDAAKIFGEYTESHTGHPLAIALDGRILSIPVIQTRLDKQGIITGNFTESEAKRLAAQLRAGALPLPLTVTSIDTVEAVTVGSGN